MVKSKDIAEMAGVSRQAVSAVLNGRGTSKVSKEKREKILRLARELHYRPNHTALSLAGRKTHTIGVILDGFCGIGALHMQELSRELFLEGYVAQTILFESSVQAHRAIGNFISTGVEAIVFPNYILEEIRHENLPVPALATGRDIVTDYAHGTELATRHLLGHGHRKIALLISDLQFAGKDKYEGYRRVIVEAGLEEYKIFVNTPDLWKSIEAAMKDGVTALISSGDTLTRRIIDLAAYHHVRVPEDIAIIGFDGMIACGAFTTVVDPVKPFAEAAARLLLRKIATQDMRLSAEKQLVRPFLHIGNSCGCPYQPWVPSDGMNSYTQEPVA